MDLELDYKKLDKQLNIAKEAGRNFKIHKNEVSLVESGTTKAWRCDFCIMETIGDGDNILYPVVSVVEILPNVAWATFGPGAGSAQTIAFSRALTFAGVSVPSGEEEKKNMEQYHSSIKSNIDKTVAEAVSKSLDDIMPDAAPAGIYNKPPQDSVNGFIQVDGIKPKKKKGRPTSKIIAEEEFTPTSHDRIGNIINKTDQRDFIYASKYPEDMVKPNEHAPEIISRLKENNITEEMWDNSIEIPASSAGNPFYEGKHDSFMLLMNFSNWFSANFFIDGFHADVTVLKEWIGKYHLDSLISEDLAGVFIPDFENPLKKLIPFKILLTSLCDNYQYMKKNEKVHMQR